MEEIIEKLVSENTLNFGKCKSLEDYAELENSFVKKILKAINYTPCCTELKDKEVLSFEEWLDLNNYAKSTDAKYLDENANWFTEKQLLKMYNDIF